MVYPDGEVTPCFQMCGHKRFGNLERQSFDQIFYGGEFRRLREQLRTGRYGEVCRTCAAGGMKHLGEDAAEKLQRLIFPGK
jgi:radical SAM protein with 4Fe4S-binding SPASM domain